MPSLQKKLREINHNALLVMCEDDIVTFPEDEDILIMNFNGKTTVLIPIEKVLVLLVEQEGKKDDGVSKRLLRISKREK